MSTYWDTSAVINAAVSTAVMSRLDKGEHITRLHTLAEFFSTMTGRGVLVPDNAGDPIKVVFDADDCATWLRTFAEKVQFEELPREQVLEALDQAQTRGVQGPMVYDYFHLVTARRAGADEVLTRNTKHFEPLAKALGGQLKVEWP